MHQMCQLLGSRKLHIFIRTIGPRRPEPARGALHAKGGVPPPCPHLLPTVSSSGHSFVVPCPGLVLGLLGGVSGVKRLTVWVELTAVREVPLLCAEVARLVAKAPPGFVLRRVFIASPIDWHFVVSDSTWDLRVLTDLSCSFCSSVNPPPRPPFEGAVACA